MTVTVLLWRLAATDRHGIPIRGDRAASVIIGATTELPDGARVWFRVLTGPAAPTRDTLGPATICEVRPTHRARERTETTTGLYLAKRWTVVDPPTRRTVPTPPLQPEHITDGTPLLDWATRITRTEHP